MGVCRQHPPVPLIVGAVKHPTTGNPQPVTDSFWPQVPDSEWCGQWERTIDLSRDLNVAALESAETEGTA